MATWIRQAKYEPHNKGDGVSQVVTLDSPPANGNTVVAFLIGGVNWDGGATFSGSGWTEQINTQSSDPPYSSTALWWKTVGAGEPQSYTFTFPNDDAGLFCVMELTGVVSPYYIKHALNQGTTTGVTALDGAYVTSDGNDAYWISAIHIWNSNGNQNFGLVYNQEIVADEEADDSPGDGAADFAVGVYQGTDGASQFRWTWQNPTDYGGGYMFTIVFAGFPQGKKMKVWNGGSWVEGIPSVWDGGSWRIGVPKVWDGGAWV